MANVNKIKRPPVYIELDKERQLKYTLNSFADMEERYGTVDAALKAMEANSMKAVIFVLWAGLTHEDENLTERQVGGMIDILDMEDITEKLNTAMAGDMADKGPAKVGDKTESPNV